MAQCNLFSRNKLLDKTLFFFTHKNYLSLIVQTLYNTYITCVLLLFSSASSFSSAAELKYSSFPIMPASRSFFSSSKAFGTDSQYAKPMPIKPAENFPIITGRINVGWKLAVKDK